MDSQRVHLRSTVIVNQALLDQLPPIDSAFELELPGGAEARIVANRIVVVGGTTHGYHLKLVGELIGDLGTPGVVTSKLVNEVAPRTFDGRAGMPMTVVAGRLTGGGGVSVGQQGSKGDKGRDGIHMPPIDQPIPEPPFPQGPPPQIGRDGEQGGKGRRGGDGGPVQVVLLQPSAVTGAWFGRAGAGGERGQGGAGEQVPKGGVNGDPGLPGDPGDAGKNVAATVRVVDLDTWRNAVSSTLMLGPWARHREALGLEEFRRDNPSVALNELAESVKLVGANSPGANPLARHLPRLVRDNRAITGVARDADLVPDITHHAAEHAKRAAALTDALPSSGPISGIPTDRLAILKTQLTVLLNPGGDFTVQNNDLRGQADKALLVINELAKRTSRTNNRLNSILHPEQGPAANPAITVKGLGRSAPDVAAALVTVLGAQAPFAATAPPDGTTIWPDLPTDPFGFQPAGDQATLLPIDLNLLVNRSIRGRGETITPGELQAFRSGAAGLARLGEWGRVAGGQAGSDGKPVVVDLAGVAAELRGAIGDRAVLDLLVELAELAHGWRLARARIEQMLAGRETLELQKAAAIAVRDKPVFFPSLIGPADLLPAVRCILDALGWYADRAARASAMLTLGLSNPEPPRINRYPLPPELTGEVAGALPILHSPDWELDLEEQSPTSLAVSTFDQIVSAVRQRDTAKPYRDYLKRGIPIVGFSPPPVRKVFGKADRPDVIARFAATGQFWFDVTLADLAGPQGSSPHVEARVVGVRVSFEFTQTGPGVDVPVLVTHTGFSTQLDMAGHEHRQAMLPAGIAVNVAQKVVDGVPAERLYEGETALNTPGQTPIAPIDFPVYGRGAAASWLVQRQETLTVLPALDAIVVEVLYECMVPANTASLRSVAFAPAGLRVGSEAAIRVTLTGPAGPGGVPVKLASSDPSIISLPSVVVVPEGLSETTALATVSKPTGALPPVLTAATADGVTRRARPVIPKPTRPLIASTRLAPVDRPGSVAAVAILPGPTGQPGTPLASVAPPREEPGTPEPPSLVMARRPDLGPQRQAEVGHQPRSLAVDPQRRRVYVANAGDRSTSVSMLDADTLKTIAERKLGFLVDVEVDSGAGLLYVSMFGTGSVMVLSADDLSVVTEITDPASRLRKPHGMAIVSGRQGEASIYVARTVRGVDNEESAVTLIRRAPDGKHSVIKSLDLEAVGVQPVDVAVDPVHGLVFVACLGGGDVHPELVVLRHPSMTVQGRVPLFSTGRAVAARPGSGLAYVVGEAGLTIVDGRALAVTSRTQLGGVHLDAGLPVSVAVDPVTGTAYVGTLTQATLFRIDTPTHAGLGFW